MKYIILLFALFIFACNGPLLESPATPQTVWIDLETKSDTIITNVGSHYSGLYYASKNWQQATDTNLLRGYRFIAIRFGDSILVKLHLDSSTDYDGPFLLLINEKNDTLKAQIFLDSVNTNPARLFTRL